MEASDSSGRSVVAPAVARGAASGRDFPEWVDPMMVKELRQGLRARWFVIPFVLIHACASAVVWIEFAATARNSSGGIDASLGHRSFWGLAFIVAAGILPLRGLDGVAQEMAGGNAQLITLTGVSRWRISVGKWLTQMALSALILVSLLPYAIVRYFFGGVEAVANLGALALVIGSSSALTALLIGASGYSTYLGRGLVTTAAYGLVGLPAFVLVLYSGDWRLPDDARGFSAVVAVSLTVAVVELFVFYTLCGLQLTRAHLRVALRAWEVPPTRPVLMLFLFGHVYVGIVSGFTCGFGAFVIGALLIWWVASLDRERVRLPEPAFMRTPADPCRPSPSNIARP
jgi:hypothetical protein